AQPIIMSPIEPAIIAKLLWSAGIVVGLTWLAEHVGTRLAGIVSGAPQNAAIVYYFLGQDMGPAFAAESAPHGVAAFTATLGFVIGYDRACACFGRLALLLAPLLGLAIFLALSQALSRIALDLAPACAITGAAVLAAYWLLRRT